MCACMCMSMCMCMCMHVLIYWMPDETINHVWASIEYRAHHLFHTT